MVRSSAPYILTWHCGYHTLQLLQAQLGNAHMRTVTAANRGAAQSQCEAMFAGCVRTRLNR